jgi:hypothetical protein
MGLVEALLSQNAQMIYQWLTPNLAISPWLFVTSPVSLSLSLSLSLILQTTQPNKKTNLKISHPIRPSLSNRWITKLTQISHPTIDHEPHLNNNQQSKENPIHKNLNQNFQIGKIKGALSLSLSLSLIYEDTADGSMNFGGNFG